MGSLTIEIPLKINRTFRVENKQDAEKLLRELENLNKKKSAFEDVFGIWAEREEIEKDLTKNLRRKSNLRNG
ncbi:MAG TPA: hypothetical protein VNI84_05735 [Pyrinomonadaceae bacterium]|nr:hypothetical protein [Pyrinomonadaceae bacterium]